MPDPTPTHPTPAPSSLRYRIAITAAIAVAIGALVIGVRHTKTGEDDALTNGRRDVVEHVYPKSGAEVLRQVEVGIDLAPGYEATLFVNGTEIPADELRPVPEQNQVFFAPEPGKVFESLPEGLTCVTALAWKSSEGRGSNDLTFRWCFDVT